MLHPSPSQEAFTSLTRASSFHGPYPGGDTQPMESQVYRDFNASIIQPTRTTPKKPILNVQISPDGETTYNTVMPEGSPRTCVEGDTGYVDLENALLPSSPAAPSTSSHVGELLDDPQTQHQLVDDFAKPAMPETPAIAGSKRDSSGDIVTSPYTHRKTPGFTQLFGGHDKGQLLSATQLFDQTQAPSSPQPNGPRSDPVITRPSPNFHHQMSVSSPAITMSSPLLTTHSRPGTAGEPRDGYTNMWESQERKAARAREELALRKQFSEDIMDDDEDDDNELMRYEREKRRKVLHEQAAREWSGLRAPSRPSSRPTSRHNSSPHQATTIDLVTPAPNRDKPIKFDGANGEVDYSDDDLAVEEELMADVQNSDDEWDELGQTVLQSQPNNDEDDDDGAAHDQYNMGHAEVLHEEHDSPHGLREDTRSCGEQTHQSFHLGTQQSAIADSQPTGLEKPRSAVPQQSTGLPSISSVVPGSQYATTRDQDKRTDPVVAATSSSRLPMTETAYDPSNEVPSSPPLQAPAMHQEISEISMNEPLNDKAVPETDLPDTGDGTGRASSPAPPIDGIHRESNPSNPFLYSTARTHVSESGPSPQKRSFAATPSKIIASQQSKTASQTPRTAAGVRHFADIAAAASTPNGSGETNVDVEAILSDVVTTEDQEFIEAVATPSEERQRKRRKTTHAFTTDGGDEYHVHEPVISSKVPRPQRLRTKEYTRNKTVVFSNTLQDSPSKANELRSETPLNEQDSTPDSVKERERAGATAASQLLSNRKSTSLKPLRQYGKNNKRSSVARQKSSAATSSKSGKSPPRRQPRIAARRTEEVENDEDVNMMQEMEETGDVAAERIDEEDRVHASHTAANEPDQTDVFTRAPNRIFALFNGQPRNFYPATCLGISPDGSTYQIKFDDNSITSTGIQDVCRLELCVGDVVKIDQQGLGGKWQIDDFGAVAQNIKQLGAGTDVYGRMTVKVSRKSNRDSDVMVKPGKLRDSEAVVEVPVNTIYLTRTMWSHFADRVFSLASTTDKPSRIGTPSSSEQQAPTETSVSRSGRTLLPTSKVRGKRASHLRDESVSAPESPTMHGMFSGMAFAISYSSNEADKAEVTRLVRSNGGIVFEKGFDELFSLPTLDESAPTSPAKKSPRKGTSTAQDSAGLHLKPEYEDIGFVALIADCHSRRAKYFQALALSLPTLSGRWIVDSLDSLKNSSLSTGTPEPVPWTKYLLPAGESIYLGGAIRSRTMSVYNAARARLSNIIETRDILLQGDGVLIVASKKGKSTVERWKTYAFLSLALGAAGVKRVSDLAEAKAFATKEPQVWKWIYVDGSVAEASAVVFGKGGATAKKRKRGEEGFKVDVTGMCASDGKLRIVNDEFVVQSLILGALVD